MKRASNTKGIIPVCRSDYLQDVTIALGKRMKAVRYASKQLSITVSKDVNCDEYEKLTIEARTALRVQTRIVIWNDAVAWIYQRIQSKSQTGNVFELHADLAKLTTDEVAQLIRQSLVDLSKIKNVWLQNAIPS